MESTIRLFKAVPVKSKGVMPDENLMEKTIKKGFIFSPEVTPEYLDYSRLIEMVEKNIGITAEQLNSSFHKSWTKVRDADMEQLVAEQIVHYITTYGFEALGIYSEDTVYIPSEKLEIPETDFDGINLTVIHGLTKEELKERLLNLLNTGIALGEDTIKDVVDVATFVEIDENDIENIKNKEVRVILYDYLGMVPENPTEFLRFLVYKSIEKTLLIKSPGLIAEIKEHQNIGLINLFTKYETKQGLGRLAEIFYRFKPIFLAFRTNKNLKSKINRIRRLAVKNHKPMPEDYLNNVTAMLKRGSIKESQLTEELGKVNIFRKIRLAYALKFRTKDVDSILYRVRNGKGYATEFEFDHKESAQEVLDVVLNSITTEISENVKGKKVYIPSYINYAFPATEKQFTGNFPSGSYISCPRDMIVGINWKNVKSHRIDLDLSVISETEKYGWDGGYRSADRDILFSGDITDASGKNGATELFYVQRQSKDALILFINYYNYEEDVAVPFKIIVAQEQARGFEKNYMIDPNNLLATVESKITQRQKMIGLLVTTDDECKFYFTETNIGKSITSGNSDFVEHSRKYLFDFYENSINLKELLESAGAEMVTTKEDADFDLSPEELTKDSILNLIIKNNG